MTRETALNRIFVIWFVATIALGLFFFTQTLAGKYGSDFTVAGSWLSAQIIPVIGLLLAAAFASPDDAWKRTGVTGRRYHLALAASVVQIVMMAVTLLIEPFITRSPFELFDMTIVFLSLWQGIVTACVGALVFDGR